MAQQAKLGRTAENVVHDLTAIHIPSETAQALVSKIYRPRQSAQLWNDVFLVLGGSLLVVIVLGLTWWVVTQASHTGGRGVALNGFAGQDAVGILLLVLGASLSLGGGIWFLVAAFQESLGWGCACFVFPFSSLIFLFLHPERALKPFGVSLVGSGLAFVGLYLQGQMGI